MFHRLTLFQGRVGVYGCHGRVPAAWNPRDLWRPRAARDTAEDLGGCELEGFEEFHTVLDRQGADSAISAWQKHECCYGFAGEQRERPQDGGSVAPILS